MLSTGHDHSQNKALEKRLLIVDDDEDFIENLTEILERRGYSIITAHRLNDVPGKIRNMYIQVALVDMRLSDGSGIDVILTIKRENSDCVCIVITANADLESAIASVEQGVFDYLIKPVNPVKLLTLLDRAFEIIQLREEKRLVEERNRAILRTTIDGFWIVDTRGRILEANEAYVNLTGHTHQELLEMTISDIEVLEESADTQRHIQHIIKSGHERFETRHRCKDGRIIDVEVSVNYVSEGEGCFFSFIRDITWRKHLEKALEAQRQRLFQLLEQLPAYVCLHAPDYSLPFTNSYFRKHFGDPKEKPCHMILRGRSEPCHDCPTFHVFDTKTPQIWDWTTAPNDRIYQVYDYPFTNTDGTLLVLELGVDITERKAAEKAVKDSEQRFRSLTSNIQGAVYRCANDPHRTMEFISSHIETISGYPSTDFIGNHVRSYDSIIYAEDRQMVSDIVHEGLKQRNPFVIEYRINNSNGNIRWVYEKGQGVFDDNGVLLCLDGVIFDITEHRLGDEKLSETARELRERNKELERFHKLTVGRELTMIKLKEEVNALLEKAGEPVKYKIMDSEAMGDGLAEEKE